MDKNELIVKELNRVRLNAILDDFEYDYLKRPSIPFDRLMRRIGTFSVMAMTVAHNFLNAK